tara:strand:- start:448 stop:1224 length:777 start_codon:yes stop_codon:yes gene_type:complete
MIKQVDVKNYRLLQHCDVMVERLLKLPQTFKSVPMPNNSYHRLRQLMAVNDGRIEETNTNDYADKIGYTVKVNKEQANFNSTYPWSRPIRDYAKYKFIQYFNEELLSGSWYWDSYEVQPPKYGWTAWHNSKNKPRHFIRFIWNSGEGYTTYVENGESIKIKDKHNTNPGMTNWTVLSGTLDGNQWLSDRNLGDYPRIVLDMSIDSIRHNDFSEALALLEEYVEEIITMVPENRELNTPVFTVQEEEGQYRIPEQPTDV